jgi:DNA-binding CsgD family transcriptional regulator
VETVPTQRGAQLAEEPVSAGPAILERDRELAAVDGLIRATPDGGRLVVIEGPPGIGKTSLIVEAKARGLRAGMQVLSGRGSDLEREFSYGVVRQLFEPLLAQLPEDERAELLAGAATLAGPLFDPEHLAGERPAGAQFARLHGLFWLTANVASRGPVLLAVDDLHWCDTASLRWLGYLLPRIEGLPVLLVVGLRPSEPGADAALIGRVASDPLAVTIRPAPLGKAATARLVRATLSADADHVFCSTCHEETGGNPLLLRELVTRIAAEELAPTEANVPRLHELEARAGSRAVSLRLARLPPEAARLAQGVAILGEDADPGHAAALADLDEQASSEATVDLVRVDVLRPQLPLGFVHPLIRASVYEALTPLERDRGHARAARLLTEAEARPEQVAAHMLLVSPAADPAVVATLRDAARGAGTRGAPESAVAYLRRALAEPPVASQRADLLLELGFAEALISGESAAEHLQEAHQLIQDPVRKAEAASLLGRQLFYLRRHDESVAVFKQALDELGGGDAELERLLEAGLISTGLFLPTAQDEVSRRLERIRSTGRNGTLGEKMLLALLAFYDARSGAPAVECVALARRALAGGTLLAAEAGGGAFTRACMVLAMADLDEALTMYDAALAEAHLRGSVFAFATTKILRAHAFLFRGDLADAESDSREALDACTEWGLQLLDAYSRSLLADALIEQGRVEEAATALEPARGRESMADGAAAHFLRHSQARFRILQGDLAGGLEDMLDAGPSFERIGSRNPALEPWRSYAAPALLRLGERDEARRLADEELELARTWGAPRALGRALRIAGLVEGGTEGLGLLEGAVEVLVDSPAKLERAKARTELGAALRRNNRRSDAREQLRRAVELATICGAAPLAERAETELLATGARPRRIALSGVESLTPSERRVAEMAAEGPTNREIAQALFVTPKTVEMHLSRAYRKLGITSRSQLPAALAKRETQPRRATLDPGQHEADARTVGLTLPGDPLAPRPPGDKA